MWASKAPCTLPLWWSFQPCKMLRRGERPLKQECWNMDSSLACTAELHDLDKLIPLWISISSQIKSEGYGVAKSPTRLSDFTFTFHFHALEKEMATHSSVLAWRIPGTGEPDGLPSMGSHRVGHDWSNAAAAAAAFWYFSVSLLVIWNSLSRSIYMMILKIRFHCNSVKSPKL